MVDLTSVILLARSSAWETGAGNLPALERPGPRRRGICLMRAKKLSGHTSSDLQGVYHTVGSEEGIVLACQLLDELLVLVARLYKQTSQINILYPRYTYSFFKSSELMASVPWCLARSISCWSPKTQTDMRGRGTVGSLTVPEKRLSRCGS